MACKNPLRVPVAIAWYTAEQWERLKQVVDDPQNFEETHDEWLGVFQRGMQYLREQGYDPHKVPVDVDELVQWCGEQQRPVDGESRSAFAAEKLRATFRRG